MCHLYIYIHIMTHVICVISNAGRLGALKTPPGRTVREGGWGGGGVERSDYRGIMIRITPRPLESVREDLSPSIDSDETWNPRLRGPSCPWLHPPSCLGVRRGGPCARARASARARLRAYAHGVRVVCARAASG